MRNSKSGFTLIELVITMLIVVIVFGILANLVGFSTRFFRDENTQVANQTALRQVAVTFEKDVRRYALNSSQIASDGTCTTTFVYTIGTIGTSVTYCLESDQTIKRNGVIIAERIQTFEVDLSNTSKVHLEIETIQDSRGQEIVINYDVYFRN